MHIMKLGMFPGYILLAFLWGRKNEDFLLASREKSMSSHLIFFQRLFLKLAEYYSSEFLIL